MYANHQYIASETNTYYLVCILEKYKMRKMLEFIHSIVKNINFLLFLLGTADKYRNYETSAFKKSSVCRYLFSPVPAG